jgi:hypothetical protein
MRLSHLSQCITTQPLSVGLLFICYARSSDADLLTEYHEMQSSSNPWTDVLWLLLRMCSVVHLFVLLCVFLQVFKAYCDKKSMDLKAVK